MLTNEFLHVLRQIQDTLGRVAEATEKLVAEPTPVADLQDEAEACGRSASEADPPTLDDARRLLNDAGCTPGFMSSTGSIFVHEKVAEILYGVMLANSQNERGAEPCCYDGPAVPDSVKVTIEPCPEPLMPAIEAGLLARVRAKWPDIVFSIWLGSESMRFGYQTAGRKTDVVSRDTMGKLEKRLQSECPEPSEPEAKRAMWDYCFACVSLSVSTRKEPCKSCAVDKPSNFKPKE